MPVGLAGELRVAMAERTAELLHAKESRKMKPIGGDAPPSPEQMAAMVREAADRRKAAAERKAAAAAKREAKRALKYLKQKLLADAEYRGQVLSELEASERNAR